MEYVQGKLLFLKCYGIYAVVQSNSTFSLNFIAPHSLFTKCLRSMPSMANTVIFALRYRTILVACGAEMTLAKLEDVHSRNGTGIFVIHRASLSIIWTINISDRRFGLGVSEIAISIYSENLTDLLFMVS